MLLNVLLTLQERLHAAEWGAVVISTVGTFSLGATAGGTAEPAAAKPLSKTRIAAVLLMFSIFIVAAVFIRVRGQSRQPRRPVRTSATACGLQVTNTDHAVVLLWVCHDVEFHAWRFIQFNSSPSCTTCAQYAITSTRPFYQQDSTLSSLLLSCAMLPMVLRVPLAL